MHLRKSTIRQVVRFLAWTGLIVLVAFGLATIVCGELHARPVSVIKLQEQKYPAIVSDGTAEDIPAARALEADDLRERQTLEIDTDDEDDAPSEHLDDPKMRELSRKMQRGSDFLHLQRSDL